MTPGLPEPIAAAVAETMDSVLGQVTTLRVTGITYTEGTTAEAGPGILAQVAVEGGTHEILCELTTEGQLLSARVVEL